MKSVSFYQSVTSKSNDCVVADRHLLPSHYDLQDKINSSLEPLKCSLDYIFIPYSEITSFREFHNNTYSFGDALAELLCEKLEGYTGLSEDTFHSLDDYESDVSRYLKDDGTKEVIIVDSYSDPRGVFYFYKTKEVSKK